MSTLDVVAYAGEKHGGVKPANFLDIGGGASAEVMSNGLDIILTDPSVRAVFVNVFGGITACDAVANGIVAALNMLGDEANKPLVVRLDGNNVVEGRRILERGGAPAGDAGGHDGRRGRQGRRAGERGSLTMAIFLDENSRIIVQGMTGSEGMKHTRRMLASGATVVGGVNARKAGTSVDIDGTNLPVFGSVAEAMAETGANVTVGFVPPAFTKDSVIEAIDAEIPLAVVITEGVAVHDTATFWAHAQGRKTRIIGPNCPGVISPGKSNAGIIPADITKAGRVGLVSKSGTLTYQMMFELRRPRLLDVRRHRRRPDHRHHAHRLPGGVPERSGHRRHRHDRRDRRRRRGAGRRLHQGERHASRSSATSRGSPLPRARRWGTPARSCPVRRAPRRRRRRRSRRPGSRSARRRRETARLMREILG